MGHKRRQLAVGADVALVERAARGVGQSEGERGQFVGVTAPAVDLGEVATLTLAGQNYGAGKPERVRQAWLTALRYGLVLMIGGGLLLFAAAHPLMAAFTSDVAVIDMGTSYLRVASLTLGSYVVLYQTVFMLQGLKRPLFGLWIGLYRQIVAPAFVFPLLAFSAGLGLGGIWWGIAGVNWTAALFAAWHGRRVLRRVLAQEPR